MDLCSKLFLLKCKKVQTVLYRESESTWPTFITPGMSYDDEDAVARKFKIPHAFVIWEWVHGMPLLGSKKICSSLLMTDNATTVTFVANTGSSEPAVMRGGIALTTNWRGWGVATTLMATVKTVLVSSFNDDKWWQHWWDWRVADDFQGSLWLLDGASGYGVNF